MKKIKFFSVLLISILLNSCWILGQQTAKIDSLENLLKKVKGKEKLLPLQLMQCRVTKRSSIKPVLMNI